ncbi:MAG: acyltransferase [Phycisphaerae bacterium]
MPSIIERLKNACAGLAGAQPAAAPVAEVKREEPAPVKPVTDGITRNIRGENNRIEIASTPVESFAIDINGDNNTVIIGAGTILANSRIVMAGSGHTIRIGKRVQLRNTTLWIEDSGAVLEIGDETTSEGAGIALTEPGSKVTFGRDCMLSYDIDIRTGDSHSIMECATGERINFAEDVTFGDHVWIGAHCVVLKGVRIPSDCIIATGAIVTKSVTVEHAIVAGNPAKVVKEGVTWSRERLPRT